MAGPSVHIIAPVKADGMGAGAVQLARHLERLGVYALSTANFEDAVAIRAAGVKLKIILFASHLPQGTAALMRHGFVPTITSMAAAQAVSACAREPYPVYIKVDCGLGRLGIPLASAESLVQAIARLPNVVVEGIYTHLPFFSDSGKRWAQTQMHSFRQLVDRLASTGIHIPVAQSASSMGLLTGMPHGLNAVSAMHLLFGLSPFPGERQPPGLRLAFSNITGRLIHVSRLDALSAADRVGRFYGSTGRDLSSVHRSGVILLGVGNGYFSPAHPDRAYVLIRGRKAAVLGVTAEYTVVDLSQIPDADLGDEVVVLGRSGDLELSLWDVADYLGISPLRFLVGLRDIPLTYSDSGA